MTTLQLRNITKRYPRVLANDDISLTVGAGEVHALIGENGAGKSTLMSILYGVVAPDDGQIVIDGSERRFGSPKDAIAAGLGMVFQSFQLFGELTVAENVVFGAEPSRLGLVDRGGAERRVAEIAGAYGLDIPVDRRAGELSVGILQRVEIVKALFRQASVLILDEPTGVLTPQESESLFAVLRTLAAAGKSIILITHKLDEVMRVADRVTVLRDGRVVSTADVATTSPLEISRHMTGRDVALRRRLARRAPGDAVLRLDGVTVGPVQRPLVRDVTLSVGGGEIVGVAGIAGNGQEALAEAIAGHRAVTAGTIRLDGSDVTGADNRSRRRAGLAHIPEDRNRSGSAGDADAIANLAAGFHRAPPLWRRGILRPREMRRHADALLERFAVKISAPTAPVRTLSGGNLQKLVVARELGHDGRFLLAEQPTRGVDIGAIDAIHAELDEYRDRGGAVLLVSSELAELRNLCDRIVVLFEGRVMADLDAAAATEERIGLLMAGAPASSVEVEAAA